MKARSRCVLFAGMFGAVVASVGCASKSLDDLPNPSRDETLWTGPAGSKVVIFRYGMAVGMTPKALVCEQGQHRELIEKLPADSFALASGNELKVIRALDRTMPGWYRISKRSDLNWWERTFSGQVSAEASRVENQASLPKPPEDLSRKTVVSFNGVHWRKLADQDKLQDLLGVPGDGLVYVGEPGIGVLQVIDLSHRCP